MLMPLDMLHAGEWAEVAGGIRAAAGFADSRNSDPPGLPRPGRATGLHLPLDVGGCKLCLRPASVRKSSFARCRDDALSELRPGDRAAVVSLAGDSGLVQRLYEFGLLEGEEIELLALAPLGDPIEIRLGIPA